MILLDTNIISEMMKNTPDANVIQWLDTQEVTELFITSITIAELSYGINSLPVGNRKQSLETAFTNTVKEAFKHRILFFSDSAALFYGKIMSHRKKLGRPLSILDGQIAAIALSQTATLATRNIRDFSDCDLDLINPFH